MQPRRPLVSSDEGSKVNDDVGHSYSIAAVGVSRVNDKGIDDDDDEDNTSDRSKDDEPPCSIVVDSVLGMGTIAVLSVLGSKVASASACDDGDIKSTEV